MPAEICSNLQNFVWMAPTFTKCNRYFEVDSVCLRTHSDSFSSADDAPVVMQESGEHVVSTDENDLLVPQRRYKKRGVWRYLPQCLYDVYHRLVGQSKKYSRHPNSSLFLAILLICSGCCENLARKCRRAKHYSSRTIQLDKPIEKPSSFPANIIRNQKYAQGGQGAGLLAPCRIRGARVGGERLHAIRNTQNVIRNM